MTLSVIALPVECFFSADTERVVVRGFAVHLTLVVALTGCSGLSPVLPTPVPTSARLTLEAQPGRAELDSSGGWLYSPCISVVNPSGGGAVEWDRMDVVVSGADGSTYGSTQSYIPLQMAPGTTFATCELAVVRSFRANAARYQVVLAYRFLDGTRETLTASSSFNLPPFR